ncbi:MAG: uncharacterized protein H6Q63_468 [Firmicutes bacterium]|nr:uncharacterized protein [Bacillota bacterium]
MDKAFETYSILKEEVKRWQDERGSFWTEKLSPAKIPPHYPLKELPDLAILELCQRLNQVSNSLVSDAVLQDTWDSFKAFKPVTNVELFSRLQIALCGVAQLFRETMVNNENCSMDNQVQGDAGVASTQSMTCPICGELAEVSVLTPPNGKRYLHCSICDHQWLVKRVGCVRCGSDEASKLNYLKSEDFPGVEIIVCQACGQYSKEYDLRVMNVGDIDWENIRTIPLNYAAEKWLAENAQLSGKVQ